VIKANFEVATSAHAREFLRRSEGWNNPMVQAVFAACFCEDGDLLSQWRGYTEAGGGYALGFDLFPTMVSGLIQLRKVCYDPPEQERLIRDILQSFLDICDMEFAGRPPETDYNDWMIDLLRVHEATLVELASFIKHPSFAEEREWRLIRMQNDPDAQGTSFRSSGPNVVPYQIWDWSDAANRSKSADDLVGYPIREVVVGPQAPKELNVLSVEMVLRTAGASYSIHARPSDIPYRPL
jgi:hypothetical protein